jgi:hypothetical protein
MKPYELPTAPEGMTPDEAKIALDKIYADAGCSPDEHPYFNRHHPQNRAMQAAMTALHEVWAQRPPDRTPFSEALAERDAKQEALAQEIDAEIETLRELGFDGEPPDDPQPYHLAGFRMRRLSMQGDYASLKPLIQGELCRLAAPADLWAAFGAFKRAKDSDPDLRGQAERLIEQVCAATKRKYEGKRK